MNDKIRNLSIIAHIDHGKSTLSDRIMEQTETVSNRETKAQLLDDLDVEKEHGVTVKARAVRNMYHADDNQTYEINLIDTPGHVDFSYEVSKSLKASDNAILLVDATQGVQAQTVANLRIAEEIGTKIIPVINKIDNPDVQIDQVETEIRALSPNLKNSQILHVSAKTGQGVHELLEAIVTDMVAPVGDDDGPLSALIFDAYYDSFKGLILYVRVFNGEINPQDEFLLLSNSKTLKINEIGVLTPNRTPVSVLKSGEVGYLITGIKDASVSYIGDTLTSKLLPTATPLAGYKPAQSMVFAGIYPNGAYLPMAKALKKLALNDTSLSLIEETSDALGPGFRAGFLGVFHLQIIKERLQKEFGVDVLVTYPNVTYHAFLKGEGQDFSIVTNPVHLPDFDQLVEIEEPMVQATIITKSDTLSDVMALANAYQGVFIDMTNQGQLVTLVYKMPLSKIVYTFFNKLKSISHGYASLATEEIGYELADVVRIDIHINYARIDALTFISHRQEVEQLTQKLVHQLKYAVPRRMYPMPVQAIVEGKVLARVDVPPLRKNAAVNGKKQSISKKQELLRRQNVNKRQASRNDIELPQSVFNVMFNLDEE